MKSVTLSPDRKTATLDLGEVTAWRVYEMHLNGVQDDEGAYPLNTLICYTVNHLLENTPPPPVTQAQKAKGVPNSADE